MLPPADSHADGYYKSISPSIRC